MVEEHNESIIKSVQFTVEELEELQISLLDNMLQINKKAKAGKLSSADAERKIKTLVTVAEKCSKI